MTQWGWRGEVDVGRVDVASWTMSRRTTALKWDISSSSSSRRCLVCENCLHSTRPHQPSSTTHSSVERRVDLRPSTSRMRTTSELPRRLYIASQPAASQLRIDTHTHTHRPAGRPTGRRYTTRQCVIARMICDLCVTVCPSVCVSVRALKEQRLELSTANLVRPMTGPRHALTLRSKGHAVAKKLSQMDGY